MRATGLPIQVPARANCSATGSTEIGTATPRETGVVRDKRVVAARSTARPLATEAWRKCQIRTAFNRLYYMEDGLLESVIKRGPIYRPVRSRIITPALAEACVPVSLATRAMQMISSWLEPQT